MHERSVLIVEDDAPLRGLLRLTLASAGYDVTEAEDGYAALRRLETITPSVIVLDLGLPGLNGYGVLSELMASAHTRAIPVVVITGSGDLPESANVHCVLRKPVAPEHLLVTVVRCSRSGTGRAVI